MCRLKAASRLARTRKEKLVRNPYSPNVCFWPIPAHHYRQQLAIKQTFGPGLHSYGRGGCGDLIAKKLAMPNVIIKITVANVWIGEASQ
jgi:hypothetical protein